MASTFTLPINSTLPDFTFEVDLDGATYGFRFRWNVRAQAWFMSLSDDGGNPLLTEQRVVVGFPLGKRGRNASLPPGTLWALDTSGLDEDPGLTDLGTRVLVLYFAADS